jgi:hypothetical protein
MPAEEDILTEDEFFDVLDVSDFITFLLQINRHTGRGGMWNRENNCVGEPIQGAWIGRLREGWRVT